MPKFFTNAENGPALFTGLSTGSWSEDIDLTADASFVGSAPSIPVGATGVILRFVNATNNTAYAFGARTPGSGTNRINVLISIVDGAQSNAYTGITSNTIDIYIENSNIDVYLIGYFTAEANFFADEFQTTVNASSTGTWEAHDLSGSLSVGAVFAIFEFARASSGSGWNFRHPDSLDNRTCTGAGQHDWVIVPVDSSRNVELWSESTTSSFYLIGEITSNAENRTSGSDVSLGTTGSYAQIDMSAIYPANAVFAIVEVYFTQTTSSKKIAFRPYNDTSYADIYVDQASQGSTASWFIIPVNAFGYADGKIETTDSDFYVWGYITADAGSPTLLPSKLILQIAKNITEGVWA